MRDGPPKMIDFRKVAGKRLYVDLIERKAYKDTEVETIAQYAAWPEGKDILEFFRLNPVMQITQLAAQHILWGEKK